jgi:hypothetical protein
MIKNSNSLDCTDCCKGCFYKKKFHREYMRQWRASNKHKNQLNLPLQEILQFKIS